MYKTQGRPAAKLDQWRIYAAERADVHDFLASLTPAQWDEPSLCEGWRIRDVAVHLLVDEPVEQLGLPLALVKAGWFRFSVHRINDWWIRRNRDRPTDSILTAFAGAWQPGAISNLVGPRTSVRAMVIHHQDMRRPLGMRRVVPEERLRAALDVILTPGAAPTSAHLSAAAACGCRPQIPTGRGETALRSSARQNRSSWQWPAAAAPSPNCPAPDCQPSQAASRRPRKMRPELSLPSSKRI